MADVEKVITDLELVKASIEWEEPLDYQIMLDNAIQTIRELQEDCSRYHEWGFHEGYEEAKEKMNADGCEGCAFDTVNEWEMPCAKCKRNCKDYWRAKVVE